MPYQKEELANWKRIKKEHPSAIVRSRSTPVGIARLAIWGPKGGRTIVPISFLRHTNPSRQQLSLGQYLDKLDRAASKDAARRIIAQCRKDSTLSGEECFYLLDQAKHQFGDEVLKRAKRKKKGFWPWQHNPPQSWYYDQLSRLYDLGRESSPHMKQQVQNDMKHLVRTAVNDPDLSGEEKRQIRQLYNYNARFINPLGRQHPYKNGLYVALAGFLALGALTLMAPRSSTEVEMWCWCTGAAHWHEKV